MKLRLIGVGAALTVGIGIFAACIPHPKEEYDDFLTRTESYRNKPTPEDDSGPIDAQAPTQAIEGLYFGTCLSSLSVGDLKKVLRFYTEVRFVPGAAGGKLDIQFTPLKGVDLSSGNPVPVPPDNVSKGQTFGAPFGQKEADVSNTGRFKVLFPLVTIDKNANPISGREIMIQNVTFEGLFSATASPAATDAGTADADPGDADPDAGAADATPADSGTTTTDGGASARPRFCAALGGYVISPIQQPLDPETDFCVFVPVKEGDPVPEVKREEYKCKLQ
jgi:hypothetical protein